MEFPFDAERMFKSEQEGLVVIRGDQLPQNMRSYGTKWTECLGNVLDRLGEASSRAQGLPKTITSMSRFAGTNQRVYLKVKGSTVLGLLKVGERTLFHRDITGRCKEIIPLCVLDFYVHESVQRQGVGHFLFSKMLQKECVKPNKLAYDKPSPKLVKFLEKYYNLKHYIPQSNNFVVFEAYWNKGYELPSQPTINHSPSQPAFKASSQHFQNLASSSKLLYANKYSAQIANVEEKLRRLDEQDLQAQQLYKRHNDQMLSRFNKERSSQPMAARVTNSLPPLNSGLGITVGVDRFSRDHYPLLGANPSSKPTLATVGTLAGAPLPTLDEKIGRTKMELIRLQLALSHVK